uniref:Uncharacterized protein n=1 Tax=Pyxicephalus adspersus TaxID=30357 RepID=A0AAV2ZRV6_PYXAD|nr:TPA: hypothetical protein GDO54_002401 [Pyxicephalus adspersus]
MHCKYLKACIYIPAMIIVLYVNNCINTPYLVREADLICILNMMISMEITQVNGLCLSSSPYQELNVYAPVSIYFLVAAPQSAPTAQYLYPNTYQEPCVSAPISIKSLVSGPQPPSNSLCWCPHQEPCIYAPNSHQVCPQFLSRLPCVCATSPY